MSQGFSFLFVSLKVDALPLRKIVGFPAMRRAAQRVALKSVDNFNAIQQVSTQRFNAFQPSKRPPPLTRPLSSVIPPLLANAVLTGWPKLSVYEFGNQKWAAGRRTCLSQPPRIVRGIHPRTTPAAQNVAGNRRIAPHREGLRHHVSRIAPVLPALCETPDPAPLGG